MSDIDYYNLMKALTAKTDDDFSMINSHQKASAVRDASLRITLRNSLLERLRNSKNTVLIIGETTRFDTDWVPFEIEKAVDSYGLPIIAAYTVYDQPIRAPRGFSMYWPNALDMRINNGPANVIHIPFKKEALKDAISQFSHDSPPKAGGSESTTKLHIVFSAYAIDRSRFRLASTEDVPLERIESHLSS
jgi:hypothetical protein